MSEQRFFLPAESFDGHQVTFSSESSHQIHRVLRLHAGDTVYVLDGTGFQCLVKLLAVDRIVTGMILAREHCSAEPRAHVSLYLGTLKAAKLELVLQKATEIGVSRFVPVVTARSVATEPSDARQHRFQAIVREAAEQCRRGCVPDVEVACRFEMALEAIDGIGLLFSEEERQESLSSVPLTPHEPIHAFVGPEGGFTNAEVTAARARGIHVVTLGRRVLRAETAAIAAATLILQRTGDMI